MPWTWQNNYVIVLISDNDLTSLMYVSKELRESFGGTLIGSESPVGVQSYKASLCLVKLIK